MDIDQLINFTSEDVESLKSQLATSPGFPHFCIDNFLKEDFANSVEASFPDFDTALSLGKDFNSHHEQRKVQITDVELFPEPVEMLNRIFADESLVHSLSYATGIDGLLYDKDLVGGGMHMTNGGGRLDLHVDFNYIKESKLYRRLNVLLYLNKNWLEEYGGYLDLWDSKVENRIAYVAPKFNRLCGFVTSEISFHGVTPINCPPGRARKSFATYYYTREAPPDFSHDLHSTIFVPRPSEKARHALLRPIRFVQEKVSRQFLRLKNRFY